MPKPQHLSRRRFVQGVSVAGASTVVGGSPSWATDATLRETADLMAGPFYPQVKPSEVDADLTWVQGQRMRAAGQVVQLSGRVLDLRGRPVPGARVEVWQANTYGRYAHPSDLNTTAPLDPGFQGYAVLVTDADGGYALTTIKPGAYPTARGDMRAPHIHFDVQAAADRKVTQLFFPGEALNAQDRHLNAVRRTEGLLARLSPGATSSDVLWATWDIILTTG